MGVLGFVLQENPQLDSVYSWFVAICGCIFTTFTIGFYMISGAIYVIIQERYEVSKRAASYPSYTLITFGCILASVSGPIHYHLKTRKTMILALFICMIGSCLSVLSPMNDPIAWLTICMAIRGIGSSLVLSPMFQVTATHFVKHRAKALMVIMVYSTVAGLILPSIVTKAVNKYGVESSWLIHGAVYCQTLLLAMIIRPHLSPGKPDRDQGHADHELKSLTERSQSELSNYQDDKTEETLGKILAFLFRDRRFYAVCFFYVISITSNTAFRTTIVDYGIDVNLEPEMNHYILEIIAFFDLARVPTALLLDSGFFYEETLVFLAAVLATVTFVLLTLTSSVAYVIVVCLYTVSYAISSGCLALSFANLGSSRLAVSFGLGTGIFGLFQLGVPFLIGIFRDNYGTYDYLYYLFSVSNFFLALLFAWIRKNSWFIH